MHVPTWVPSAEQTVWPAVMHEVVELVGAEGGCCAALGDAAEGAAAGTESAADGLELSDGAAAAAKGATAATFSCTARVGTAAEGIGAMSTNEGCAVGDALDCAGALSLAPPEKVQSPTGVHSIPCTLPLPVGAMIPNKAGGTSMSLIAQALHVSVMVAVVFVPVVGLWIEICLLQTGFVFGFWPLFIKSTEMATMASPFLLVMPQEPGGIVDVSTT